MRPTTISSSRSSTDRSAVKALVNKSLIGRIDLRRITYDELAGESLRVRVENLVREALDEIEPSPHEAELIREIVDEAIGLGPIEEFLRDPTVTEIMVNGTDRIWIERDGRIVGTELSFLHEASLRTVIDRIVVPLGRRVDESSPMVDARLKDGSRVNVILPPLALGGPTVTIRKFSKVPLSIQKLIKMGSLSKQVALFLREAVRARRNILIAGGTGSGKTTLLNALSSFIPAEERIVTIEDAAELKLTQPHIVTLEARPQNIEGRGEVSIRDLVRNALRMRPDRIVVGECRGGEALDMLQAMNTGHDGSLTTAHANSPRDALLRLETMVMMSGFDFPLRAIREQLASALDLIIFQSRQHGGPRALTHVTEVCGTEEGTIVTHDIFQREHRAAPLRFLGRMPRFMDRLSPEERARFQAILSSPETENG